MRSLSCEYIYVYEDGINENAKQHKKPCPDCLLLNRNVLFLLTWMKEIYIEQKKNNRDKNKDMKGDYNLMETKKDGDYMMYHFRKNKQEVEKNVIKMIINKM